MSAYVPHAGPRQNLPWNLQTMSDGLQGGGYISMAAFYTGPKKVPHTIRLAGIFKQP